MSSITPTRRMVSTMQTATNTVIAYDTKRTGSFCTRAKSRSKATATICLNRHAKNVHSTSVNAAKTYMSVSFIVSMFPNRKLLSSGTYPGVRNTKSTPTAIPSDHTTAMAESSRRRIRCAIHSTPALEATAKTAAMAAGLNPRK